LAVHLQHALPVIPLPNLSGILTAYSNDCEPDWAFAQLVWGLGQAGDCFLALSTSGNSKNILNAAKVAREKGMFVVGLTGETGGALKSLCDCCI
jgi:D-sedoheptulose 7-phosphate isomerase